jgi:hypothetical protein
VTEIDLRRLCQQAPLGFELHATHEQIPAVAHVRADRPLHTGRYPEPDHDREHVPPLQRLHARIGDAVDEQGAEIDGDGRHRGADHPQNRVADQRARRSRPGERQAFPEIFSDATRTAALGGGTRCHEASAYDE